MGDTTAPIPTDPGSPEADEQPNVLGLVNVWAAEEWRRVGEYLPLPTRRRTLSVGRLRESGKGHARAPFVRQRPGENAPTPALASTATSRDQVLVTLLPVGLEVQNVGRRPMLVNGIEEDRTLVKPGDLIYIKHQFLFLCVERPARLPLPRHWRLENVPPFGEADPWETVGESPGAWALRDRLAFAAKSPQPVLLHGETGTGKESAAGAIAAMSAPAGRPYVTFSVANTPRTLLEDALFGHAKNYPQAGMAESPGLFARADGGTLFLDEIASLPLEAQAALLRVLDAGEYKILGGPVQHANFRLIAAMNREDSALMLDLLKRFTLRIEIPSLAARREDVPLIVRHFLREIHADRPELTEHLLLPQADGTTEVVPPASFIEELLGRERYEGNVRDVRAAVWAMLYERQPHPVPRPAPKTEPSRETAAPEADSQGDADDVEDLLAGLTARGGGRGRDLTEQEVRWYLRRNDGNLSAAARDAGVTRQSFYRAKDRFGIGKG